MDQLSTLLETVRFRSILWCNNELTSPWGIEMPGTLDDVPETIRPQMPWERLPDYQNRAPAVGGQFYVVLQGAAFVKIGGVAEAIPVAAGDLVMVFPGGQKHSVCDAPETPAKPVWDVRPLGPKHDGEMFRYGGGGALTKMMYGAYLIDDDQTSRLLSVLPAYIKVPGENGRPVAWVEDTLRLLHHEQNPCGRGTIAVNSVIARFIFVQVIRSFIAELPSGSESWLKAFLDPTIGPTLGFIHLRPEAPWTVDALAKAACMSRSTFAARFTELVGQSPLQYVTACRMQKARDLLGDIHISIKETASLVGYGSEAAFSTAFKRTTGLSPYAYKKRHGSVKNDKNEKISV